MGLRSDRSDEAEGLRPDACLVISRLGLVGQPVRGKNGKEQRWRLEILRAAKIAAFPVGMRKQEGERWRKSGCALLGEGV